MENTPLDDILNILGFYELDTVGIVLYSQQSHKITSKNSERDKHLNKDLFNEVLLFENSADLRRLYQNFVAANFSTQAFTFAAEFSEEIIPVRIMLVRIWNKVKPQGGASYFLDIKLE